MYKLATKKLAFTLIEVIVSLGLAAALALLMLLLGTTALSTDAKVNNRQLAAAVVEAQLELLGANVAIRQDPKNRDVPNLVREQFWMAADGAYSGPGTSPSIDSGGTSYSLSYHITTVTNTNPALNASGNRLRKVDLTASWWEGEKGRPGYGNLSITRSRVLRESDVR